MVTGYYAWEDYAHTGNLNTDGRTPQEALDEESRNEAVEVLISFEDDAGNVLAIVRHIDDQVIGAWIFMP